MLEWLNEDTLNQLTAGPDYVVELAPLAEEEEEPQDVEDLDEEDGGEPEYVELSDEEDGGEPGYMLEKN